VREARTEDEPLSTDRHVEQHRHRDAPVESPEACRVGERHRHAGRERERHRFEPSRAGVDEQHLALQLDQPRPEPEPEVEPIGHAVPRREPHRGQHRLSLVEARDGRAQLRRNLEPPLAVGQRRLGQRWGAPGERQHHEPL
jgi:hypothetical protein